MNYHDNSSSNMSNSSSGGGMTLEDTIRDVRDRVWSIGDAAMRGIAEVLVEFGLSPEIVGYTNEDLYEEGTGGRGPSSRTMNEGEVVVASASAYTRRQLSASSLTEDPNYQSALTNSRLQDGMGDDVQERMHDDIGEIGYNHTRPSGGWASNADQDEGGYEEDKKDK